jgi:hypothetical protein
LDIVRFSSTIRFVQGYRYLDRCGEALVRLEDTADEGWIPGEVKPSGGQMNNWRLGMNAQFNSESMTLNQTEYISFDHFQDQACKIYEILWKTFDIEKILTPTLQVILQIGFEDIAEATVHALELDLFEPEKKVLEVLGGRKSAVDCTLCTEADVERDGKPVVQRRRLQLRVLRQEGQPAFDERVMKRLRLLPVGQQKALGDLMQLRRRYPTMAPAAVQFDLENAWEGELLTRTFDLASFLKDSWEWASNVREALDALRTRRPRKE